MKEKVVLPITKDDIDVLYDGKYLNLYNMKFNTNPHYLVASRRKKDELIALKSKEEYKDLMADAVTCVLVIRTPGEEPRVYFEREFRYPVGRFLFGPPAGLIDPEDGKDGQDPRIAAAKREIREETGIIVKDSDTAYVATPLVYSSPGMTDESNAMVCVIVDLPDLSSLNLDEAEGSEVFGDYCLLTKDEAREFLKNGRDDVGLYYTIYTWAALLYFVYET
ncbi:MAG: NUDIX hydrolase [Firmicutes bacterium]|nr:NUDIX hydrolase [Bacillota bacterium]